MKNLDKFHVVTVVSNPVRFNARYKLYQRFAEDMKRKGGTVWTIELQTGARCHKITKDTDPFTVQLWNSSIPGELWHKENLLNILIQYLTMEAPDWRYVMWADADIRFEEGMVEESAQMLQHFDVIQPWSHCVDLGPDDETINVHQSFMYCYWKGIQVPGQNKYYDGDGHPGFAWCARRESLNKLGGLIDTAILGSADRHMATALVGRVKDSYHHGIHQNYKNLLNIWESRAEREIKRNVGYVPGTIRHYWHGKKMDRGYSSRWRILVDNQFNPETDIKKDVSGLWQLVTDNPRQIKLRDDIRKYFRDRNEDSIDR